MCFAEGYGGIPAHPLAAEKWERDERAVERFFFRQVENGPNLPLYPSWPDVSKMWQTRLFQALTEPEYSEEVAKTNDPTVQNG